MTNVGLETSLKNCSGPPGSCGPLVKKPSLTLMVFTIISWGSSGSRLGVFGQSRVGAGTYSCGQHEKGASSPHHATVQPPSPAVLENDPHREDEHQHRKSCAQRGGRSMSVVSLLQLGIQLTIQDGLENRGYDGRIGEGEVRHGGDGVTCGRGSSASFPTAMRRWACNTLYQLCGYACAWEWKCQSIDLAPGSMCGKVRTRMRSRDM